MTSVSGINYICFSIIILLIEGLADYYHVLSVVRITSWVHQYMCGYVGGWLNIMTHITVFNRVLVIQFSIKMILLLRHDNITLFTSRQYYSIYVTTISLLSRPFLLS